MADIFKAGVDDIYKVSSFEHNYRYRDRQAQWMDDVVGRQDGQMDRRIKEGMDDGETDRWIDCRLDG